MKERVPLSGYTTLRVGGEARYFADCKTEKELQDALTFAKERDLQIAVIGGGSNLLVTDEGFEGLVVRAGFEGITFTDQGEVIAGAGVGWDTLVLEAGRRGLWGIENLAGIPGTVGGAVVQNIGAYGAELSSVFLWAQVFSCATGAQSRIEKHDVRFGYRDSRFKQERDLVIMRAALKLSQTPRPLLSYADLAKAQTAGETLATPADIGEAVRRIRAKKFPTAEGSAGSFFKNPILADEEVRRLKERFPGLPTFTQGGGRTKVSLAWLLDHALNLAGYSIGSARLFEKQPLVIATSAPSLARDVEMLAREIEKRVHDLLGIDIEREVETIRAI